MFVFDYCEDLDIATYEYRIYQANQIEADPAHSGYYKLINAATIDSGTIAPYSQGFNLSNVFTVAVENSTTTSSSTTTSPISYYGAIRAIDTSANLGPWTLITKTSTDTPLIDQQFIGSLTAAKITTGTLGAAEITLNGANSIIKSSNYSAGSLGWKITGFGDAEFNDLTVRTSLDIGGLDASSFHVDINGNMWLGASTYASAPFKVSNTGSLTATSVDITGAVMTTPAITGGSISGSTLDIGGLDSSSFHVDVSGNIWSGAGTFNTSTNPFSVTAAGALRATGANISGAITATSGTFNGRLQAGDIYIPNTTSPVFSVTTAGVLTATNANITGAVNASSGSFTGKITVPGTQTQFGTNINNAANYQGIKIGGLAGEWKNAWVERNDGSVYFNAQNVAGTNRFYMDSSDSLLSMGNGVFSVNNDGAMTASNATITGQISVNNIDIGKDVGPGTGHHGISLSKDNFSNIFIKRESDGIFFFRVNEGGTNSITFDSSSGVLNITGTVNASAGTIGGWLITSTLLEGQVAGNGTRVQLLKSVPANLTYYGNSSYHGRPAIVFFDNLNTKAIGYLGSYGDNIVSMEGISGSTYIEIDSDGADGITLYADTNSLSAAAGIHLGSGAQNVWFDSYTHSGSPAQYLRILADGRAVLGAPSDISLKQNINTAPSVIEKVKQLNIVNFYWKDKYSYGSAEQIGLIAQELEQVFPSFVGLDHSTNKKNISTDPLLFVCIKAIQELCDKIDFLELKLENG
jgi:hypothetical protein